MEEQKFCHLHLHSEYSLLCSNFSQQSNISIAQLEENKLIEFHKESRTTSFSVGDIYLAKVRKLMPGLNAAFIDVGHEKGAFLHYQDLGPQFSTLSEFTKNLVNSKKRDISISKIKLNKIPLFCLALVVQTNVEIALFPEFIFNGCRLGAEVRIAMVTAICGNWQPRRSSHPRTC